MSNVTEMKVWDLIKEVLEIEEIDNELCFKECEMWDSLAQLSLVAGCEELGVDLTGDDLEGVNTVGELFGLIQKRQLA